ncbi:hypothetical protein AAFN47_22805, partial [Hoeflea sp. CAU 1731]
HAGEGHWKVHGSSNHLLDPKNHTAGTIGSIPDSLKAHDALIAASSSSSAETSPALTSFASAVASRRA